MKIYKFSKKYVKEYEKQSPKSEVWKAALQALIVDEFVKRLSPELQEQIITECTELKIKEVEEILEDQISLDDF